MATRTRAPEPNFWEENRSLITTGIIILIVLALGFLGFDTLTRNKDSNTDKNDQKQSEEKKDSTDNKSENGDKNNSSSGSNQTGKTTLPTSYTVARGDSLWKIAQSFYGDAYKWTVIAKENNLPKPDVLYVGTKLNIPKIEASTPVAASVNLPTSYTVVRGDSLWTIAQRYYGSGYDWYKIRDANAGKVGKLSNGRPLIEIGSVLTIPAK